MRQLFHRSREIQRLRGSLERDGYPRLQMFFLVALTGGSGFIASYGLLMSGLVEMWVRYFAVFGIAYLVFLFLLWLWLRTRAEDFADLADVPDLVPSSSGHVKVDLHGHGGNFNGGGASGSYEDDSSLSVIPEDGKYLGDALGAAADADEFAIPLVLIIFCGALILSSFWIVYAAPVLFAELLVDGVLAASLYRRLRGLETRHWLETAVRRTLWPFLLTAVIAATCGWGMKQYAPEAHSLGDVIRHAKQVR